MSVSSSSNPARASRIAFIQSCWHREIVDQSRDAFLTELAERGFDRANIELFEVPGAFEIPFGIKSYWDASKYKDDRPLAFIALGCVLRGDTPHFDYVCKAVTDGILQLNLSLPIPTIFGILTVDNQQQADERIGGKHGHKGEEAAITALKMISVVQSFKKQL